MPADMEGCDIGPETMKLFADAVKASKTVVWNGPMGVFENPTLAAGTLAVAKAMAESDATTVIGGGDSAAAVQQMGLGDKMTHISTGGGASLEYLEGKELPASRSSRTHKDSRFFTTVCDGCGGDAPPRPFVCSRLRGPAREKIRRDQDG